MAHSFNRHVKICTEADLANAQRIAWKLYRPEPRQPTRTKTGYGGATLEECAQVLGITREGVRLIEKKALAKCRSWCEAQGLDLEDLLDAMRC
ncbi:MAG: hypothetical protein H6961_11645 [Chromatiaceae bacterium]|nr:hypothetical protein [Gammaproteobacteria bacterium]MCP5415245.1 hypothetical protein [Chromatiaceae bacterium]MCP5435175.1 hypothetical protein [Chromatiaceae bacterium]